MELVLHGLAGSKFVVRVKAVIDHFWRRSNYSPVFFKRLPFRLKVSWRIRVVASKYSLWSSVSVCSWFPSIVFCTCNISSCRWRNSMHGEVRKLTLYTCIRAFWLIGNRVLLTINR